MKQNKKEVLATADLIFPRKKKRKEKMSADPIASGHQGPCELNKMWKVGVLIYFKEANDIFVF